MARRVDLMRRGWACCLVCVLLTSLAGLAPTASAAPAAGHHYVVNSTLDGPDDDPTDGICFNTPSGKCTLRAAIMESNFAAGPNSISLPAGTYSITRLGYDDAALVGDFDIGHDLTLQGAGSAATIIDGNGSVTGDRVFQILSSAQDVTLSGLTIRNGQSLSSTVGVIGGGGLYMEGHGHLSLSDVILDGNRGQNGGGVYANLSGTGGLIELDHVSLHANTAVAGGVGQGGGVFAHLPSSTSGLAVRDSQVYSNTADGTGGGLFVDGSSSTQWSIERSAIYSNTAASGGGIGNFVPLAMTDSQLHDNHATFDGGAIEAFAPLSLARTTLAANTAGRYGGGIFDLQTSANALYPDFASISQSTFSGNAAQYGGAVYHDGFVTPGSRLSLTNNTFSGNVVFRRVGATGTADGGGIYVYGGILQLFNTTIAGNRVQLGFSHSYSGIGGGLYITASATLTAENSIIANNAHGNGIMIDTPDDCFSSGTVGTLAYDLFLTTANCFVTGPQGGNIVGQDPVLGPLQNNGGSTQTRALLAGSPAIDAGFSAGCTGAGNAPITSDQRGAPRPAFGDADPTCDMGAFEVVPEADLSAGQQDQPDPVVVGRALTYTLTIRNNGPAPATGVLLTDTLPASATLRTVASTQGSCLGTVSVTCNLGSMASAASITLTVSVTPTAAGTISNTATVSGNQFDPDLSNNTASETTLVVPVADLSVGQQDHPDPVPVGWPLTYTVTVSNNSLAPVSGVVLTDTLPGSTILRSATPTQGSCLGTVIVVCNLGSMAGAASVTVTVVVTPTAAGTITNTVALTANASDPNLLNNTASETTRVLRQVFLPLVARGP